jgi:hypothetical protein
MKADMVGRQKKQHDIAILSCAHEALSLEKKTCQNILEKPIAIILRDVIISMTVSLFVHVSNLVKVDLLHTGK